MMNPILFQICAISMIFLSEVASADYATSTYGTARGDRQSVCTWAKNLALQDAMAICARSQENIAAWIPLVSNHACSTGPAGSATNCSCTVEVRFNCENIVPPDLDGTFHD
ncbi:MAG: hypothetical protein JNL01_12580 [Bdellovibrionales bacterium]|nr:hypothetical protein [Bdellovibrionales bacterium]